MADTFRESFVGQLLYRASGKRILKYAEERPDFEVPARYRRDESTKEYLAIRSKRIEAKKNAKEEYGKLQKQREEKPIRIAPPAPKIPGGEKGFVAAAERRAVEEHANSNRPIRLGPREDEENTSRISADSSATRVERDEAPEGMNLNDDDDPNMVTWYGPDDQENPQNWSLLKKCHVTFCICLITFAVYMGSSIVTPGIQEIMAEFGVAQVPATLTLSLFVAGYGLGPLVWSPLTEIPSIGRNPPYILTLIVFVVLQVPTALVKNFAGLCVLRFLAGFFGSPPLATGGASLQDLFSTKTRTFALGVWGIAASSGPALGPVVAGFAAQYKGWRWTFWELLWLSGGALLFLAIFMPETSSQTILYKRAQRLRRLTGNKDLVSEGMLSQSKMGVKEVAQMTIVKPFVLTLKEGIVLANNLFIGFVYAVLYSFFESFPLVYVDMYGMSLSISELPFIGLLIGSLVGYTGLAIWHKVYWCAEYDRLEGKIAPEKRLLPAIPGALCLPISLFMFAWASGRTHWIVPIIATGFFGAGTILLFNAIINYLTDAYPTDAASVLASNDFIRSAFGAGMPLASHGLFVNLGVDWGVSLLGFVSVLFLPLPFVLYFYGPFLRTKSPRAVSAT